MINHLIKFFLENRLVTLLLLVLLVAWGLITSPFNWQTGLPKDSVPVDAIPDIGENQQIVFTEWAGRSPQDIEDQISYPLTTALLGIPGVKTIRSSSIFGVSSIYIIFDDDIEFYWSRSRILEKLNALPSGLLPEGVQPALGPDGTALGQIFWYTLEGRDEDNNPAGGWDPQELRSIQDYNIKYALASAKGVAEVASIGGFVKEYQVDIDPTAMEGFGVNLEEIAKAVKDTNLDVGAKTLEINRAEYLVRGLGYVKSLEDLENAVVKTTNNSPILLKQVANVMLGPASRRGALDKGGAEAVGGVVVARYGENPLAVIENVKSKISNIQPGLPSKKLADGRISKLTIVPFYDRTQLINETIGTLEEALTLEVIITIIVVLVMLFNLKASLLISSLLPVAVLASFIAMRYLNVDANIVALSGIAIAIGTMVDVGIILTENITRQLKENTKSLFSVILEASQEVAPAIVTAVLTTIVSFIPVFSLEAAEGKLFGPLAYTKTFALFAALIVTLTILPTLAYWVFGFKSKSKIIKKLINALLAIFGIYILFFGFYLPGSVLIILSVIELVKEHLPSQQSILKYATVVVILIAGSILLSEQWLPLGTNASPFANFIFVGTIIGTTLGAFKLFISNYTRLLLWCLNNRIKFLLIPSFLILFATSIWLGFERVFGFVPQSIQESKAYERLSMNFPGIGKEFMPSLDEGAFLLMPSSMPHAGIQQSREVLRLLDMAVASIPEVELVVGKLGRVESALDPAPISMYENVINYKSEYKTDLNGRRVKYKHQNGEFVRTAAGELIEDKNGRYFRQWRDEIRTTDDIWSEIVSATNLPGVTSAPKLQPIETRLVMLQTGMRAPMGMKVKGPDLETIEAFGRELEGILKEVPSVKKEAVFAERIVGKPYLLLSLQRDQLARYGLSIRQVQEYIQIAIGGMALSTTVEGRERYNIRVRYPRTLRNEPAVINEILIPTPDGQSIPLAEVAEIKFERGPQMIKSEDSFLVGYVIFDKKQGFAETKVVEDVRKRIAQQITDGALVVPNGVTYEFAGNYQNQIRAEKRLGIVIPLALIIILIILYFQFRSIAVSLMVFTGVAVAFSGGFIMLWLYGQESFLNFNIIGTNIRDIFQMAPINLSVAVWVGFIALFGIATDDGVLMATYLDQSFKKNAQHKEEIIKKVVEAGNKRVRPCLMTTGTTLLALLPILSSTGRGSDVMIPMAIPSFGGMSVALITLFVVPVLYTYYKEFQLKHFAKGGDL